jgi:hypothetical protein
MIKHLIKVMNINLNNTNNKNKFNITYFDGLIIKKNVLDRKVILP